MEINAKTFEELSITELYEILQLRSAVFVVEQDCAYQDVDGKDQEALHVLGKINGTLKAYARCFGPGRYFPEAAIGRVIVHPDYRGQQYGHLLVEKAIEVIEDYYKTSHIAISAQQHLHDMYHKHGFLQEGEGYLEDAIPHIKMVRKLD